ncbi:hypothetical protein BJX64DRAFT_253564 [Aspergillus heterothallicus]
MLCKRPRNYYAFPSSGAYAQDLGRSISASVLPTQRLPFRLLDSRQRKIPLTPSSGTNFLPIFICN